MTDTTRVAVPLLSVAAINVAASNVDWEKVGGEYGEDLDWFQAFDYELEGRTVTLIARRHDVDSVHIDGNFYDASTYDSYLANHEAEDGTPLPGTITEQEWVELFEVDPSLWGSEGPMMNYFYPLPGFNGENCYSGAVDLLHQNMCIVETDWGFGLALTGGGMDMTWDIVASYVALGYLPPIDFCRHPGFDIDGDSMRYLGEAMIRSCKVTQEQAERQINDLARSINWIA